jgi:hypothetical protein
VWKNLGSANAKPAYGEHFPLKWVLQWVKEGLEIKAAITMPLTKTVNARLYDP